MGERNEYCQEKECGGGKRREARETASGKRSRWSHSLTVKIFLLTASLLVLTSLITYACVIKFLPVTYRTQLEEDLQRVSENLREELAQYESLEDAGTLLDLFAAKNQASVTLVDKNGVIVFPTAIAAEESAVTEVDMVQVDDQEAFGAGGAELTPEQAEREASEVSETADEEAESTETVESMGTAGLPEDMGLQITVSEDAVAGRAVESVVVESFEDMEVAEVLEGGEATRVFGEELQLYSTGECYHVAIGGEEYTMFVEGSMQAVGQTVRILCEILPTVLAVAAAVSVLCALAASLYLTRPIMAIAAVSRKMAQLQFDVRCREGRTDEVGVLAHSLNSLSDRLSGALLELQEANRQLRTDMEKEREEERRRTAFFAAASHELKTPVTILKGHLGGMLGQVGDYRNRKDYLQRSYEITETMEGMVQEILTVSRMESGAWEAKPEPTDVAELVRLQIAEVIELIEEKEMQLSVELPEHLVWAADERMLIKVFRNLLVNAIRYSPRHAAVRLRLQQAGEWLLFYIENTGVSIPEEALSHLFDAFFRVEGSRNRRSGGSGLGLYIVRMIVEQHGGVCGAENARDGVRVWFRLGDGSTKTT